MVIVDTTVWIDYLRGSSTPQVEWLEAALDTQRLGILDIVLCELLQGVSNDARAAELEDNLKHFMFFSTGGLELATATAQNYRLLRSKGITIRKTIDCWIGTYCLMNDHTLLHNDRDFDAFERELNLQVIHP